MDKFRCPGQDMRYWKPGDVFEVGCPECKTEVEFFKDDPFQRCPSCGNRVRNPKIDLGCAKWCEFAKECLGELPGADETGPMCDRLTARMRDTFGDDRRRIDHALKVLDHAEAIQHSEQGDPLTVRAAAILHDIGIHEAERKQGSAAGRFQEIEGPPIARRIMEELDLDEKTIDHVCRIVGSHHSAKEIDTREFRIVWDADRLVNIAEEHAEKSPDELARLIARVFKTDTGREMAESLFLKDS